MRMYVGVWGAQGKLEATLSDSSASAYVDTSVTDPGGSSDGIARVYTLTYRAASANQTLTIKWTVATMHEAQWGNVTLQAATLVTNSNSGTVYQDLQYAYTADGNITTIADHTVAGGAGDQSLTYDSLNRLTEAEGPYGTGGATASITYSYDELGNLTANSQVGTYTYPTSGSSSVRPHAVTTAGSNSYSYDANGNMTAGAGRSFTYNLENKPLTITIGGQTTTFVYAGDGGRVKKVVGSTTTRYINKLYECESTSCARMIFAGSERVATLLPSGGVQYYHPDHLGSSSVITDGTGAKVEALTYFPYGATRTNSSPVTPAVDVPYKYTGQELDASTGLYDYVARQYEAALGRFVSPDTVVPDPFNPQDLNRYTYVRNSPFNYTDPTGNITCENQYTSDCIRQWLYDLFGVDRTGTPPTQPPQSPPPDSPPVVPVREVTVTDTRLPPPIQLPPITIFPSSPPPNAPYWGEFGQRGMGGNGRGGAPTPEETRDVINGLMQDIVGSALMGGIASKNPRNADAVLKHLKGILKPGGKLIGEAGSPGVRVLSGDIKAAEDLTLDLGKLGQIRNHPQVQDGVGIDLPGGGFIGFRPHSSSGGPAIDINVTGFDDFRKIHFK